MKITASLLGMLLIFFANNVNNAPIILNEEPQASSVQTTFRDESKGVSPQMNLEENEVIQAYSYHSGDSPAKMEDLKTSDCFVITITNTTLTAEFYETLDDWNNGPSLSESRKLTQAEAEELFSLANQIAKKGVFEHEFATDTWDTTILYKGKLYTSNVNNEILHFWSKLQQLAPIDIELHGLA